MAEELSSIDLATDLTVAWLRNPNARVQADDVPAFLQAMHETVLHLSQPSAAEPEVGEAEGQYKPAVSVRKSLASPDHIISMIDGKPYRTLRRHLATKGLTPEQYRERYGLKGDYPMVAPTYSEQRRAMAHKLGLGRKAGTTVAKKASKVAQADTTPTKVKRGRKPKATSETPDL